jgi:hypothetical protein
MSKSGIEMRSGLRKRSNSKPVAQRIEIGDAERERDERAGAGAASGTDGHAVALRPVDEVGDDQEVAGEAHLHDGRRLEVEARRVFDTLRVAQRRIGIQHREASLEARRGLVAQMLVEAYACRCRESPGRKFLPSGIVRLHRCAIATELSSASGRSANAAPSRPAS